jgi:hypothetical protein
MVMMALIVCLKARQTPLHVLQKVVRSKFEAQEYPSSMRAMYEWTPDEAIPEFYTDPSLFESLHLHRGLDHLRLPDWCRDAEHFVEWHRHVLESPEVSQQLHHWIDIKYRFILVVSLSQSMSSLHRVSFFVMNIVMPYLVIIHSPFMIIYDCSL